MSNNSLFNRSRKICTLVSKFCLPEFRVTELYSAYKRLTFTAIDLSLIIGIPVWVQMFRTAIAVSMKKSYFAALFPNLRLTKRCRFKTSLFVGNLSFARSQHDPNIISLPIALVWLAILIILIWFYRIIMTFATTSQLHCFIMRQKCWLNREKRDSHIPIHTCNDRISICNIIE